MQIIDPISQRAKLNNSDYFDLILLKNQEGFAVADSFDVDAHGEA